MIWVVIVVLYKVFNCLRKVGWGVVVLQLDNIYERPVSVLNLALGLGVIGSSVDMINISAFQILGQVGWTINCGQVVTSPNQ